VSQLRKLVSASHSILGLVYLLLRACHTAGRQTQGPCLFHLPVSSRSTESTRRTVATWPRTNATSSTTRSSSGLGRTSGTTTDAVSVIYWDERVNWLGIHDVSHHTDSTSTPSVSRSGRTVRIYINQGNDLCHQHESAACLFLMKGLRLRQPGYQFGDLLYCLEPRPCSTRLFPEPQITTC